MKPLVIFEYSYSFSIKRNNKQLEEMSNLGTTQEILLLTLNI
uniref:Uncharacterized protein n=1 Tax=Heterorhabditis bacteriophora TaxID=37862 RepID=A0A1I7WCC5_HETBA